MSKRKTTWIIIYGFKIEIGFEDQASPKNLKTYADIKINIS
jgi:hypothetical protein